MASTESTARYLADQMADAGAIRTGKMFGEYAVYCDDKVVAFLCDDRLYVKPIDAARAYIGEPEEAPPYPGAKPYFLIPEERWEDHQWLSGLIAATAAALPAKRPRKR